MYSTVAVSVPRLTWESIISGYLLSAFITWWTQAAQVIPPTLNVRVETWFSTSSCEDDSVLACNKFLQSQRLKQNVFLISIFNLNYLASLKILLINVSHTLETFKGY